MLNRMKGVIFFFALVLVLSVAGCTVADQDGPRIGERLQDGLQGRGKIVPNNVTSDSFGSDYQ